MATPGLPARAQPMPHEMTPAKTQRPFWSIIIGPPLSPCFFRGNQQTDFFFSIQKLLNYSNEQFFRKCNFQNQTKNSSPQQVVDEENFCRGKKLNSAGHLDIFQENFHIQCHNSMKFNCYTHTELGDGSFVTCAIIANLDSSKKG